MWDNVPTSSGYTLQHTLLKEPPFGDHDAAEFSRILFRILLHICVDTALRIVTSERATSNGYAAYIRLIKRYSSVTISTIGDAENEVNEWKPFVHQSL